MTKATTSAIDFLAVIAGETELFETDGLTVELRSLTFPEAQRLFTEHAGDNAEIAFQALTLGLLAPKLDEDQLAIVRNGKPGPLLKIAQRVMEISGMTEGEGGRPLDGSGS